MCGGRGDGNKDGLRSQLLLRQTAAGSGALAIKRIDRRSSAGCVADTQLEASTTDAMLRAHTHTTHKKGMPPHKRVDIGIATDTHRNGIGLRDAVFGFGSELERRREAQHRSCDSPPTEKSKTPALRKS